MYGELKILAGSSHPKLSEEIARHIGIAPTPLEVVHFKNDNMMVQVMDNVRGKDVFYIQTSCRPVSDNLVEMLITLDALKHSSAGRITAVIPYFPYVRSDKKDQPRISIAARLMADLIETAGADRVLTMDLHAAQIQGFFRIPVDHLKAVNTLSSYYRAKDLDDWVVVASDIGEMKEVAPYANRLNLPIAVIDKRRTGNDDKSAVRSIVGEVKDKHCLLIDDEIATAGTMCNAAKFLVDECGARSVRGAATHGVLEGDALDRIAASPLKELMVTNTIPVGDKQKKLKKIKVLSVAGLFGDAIMRIHNGDSISVLFDEPKRDE